MSKSLARDDQQPSAPPPLEEPLARVVNIVRELLETAGAEAEAFIREWPKELVARPVVARSLPVVASLQGLSRYAAPGTRALVEANRGAWPAISTGGRPIRAPISASASSTITAGANGSASAAPSSATRSPAASSCSVRTSNIPPTRTRRRSSISLWRGNAWWRSGKSEWRLRAPGTWIHHPSWTVHAMRTAREPLLAAYVWRAGDLSAKSRIEKLSGASGGRRKQTSRAVEWPIRTSPSDIRPARSKSS